MKLSRYLLSVSCLLVSLGAYANTVSISVDHPMRVSFSVAHQNKNGQTIFASEQTEQISSNKAVNVALQGYDYAGVIITAVNGKRLPAQINHFAQPRQCSMTTDASKTQGALDIKLTQHRIICRTFGGTFG